MSDKQFFNNLGATYADVRRLDAKKINLKGKNILDYIDENKTIILDERGTQANDELDIWNSYITKDEEGNVIVDMTPTPKEHTLGSITNNQKSTLYRVAKIINNEVLDANGSHLMYWQTDGLTDASDFRNDGRPLLGSIIIFESDLSSLVNGKDMFRDTQLTSFNGDLSSLTNGAKMFLNCSSLTTFNADLSSLTDGTNMFEDCSSLETFTSDLSSLTNGMFMFMDCSNLTTFTSDLGSLTRGSQMFHNCKLDAKSVANIITFLPTNESQGSITIGIGITNNEDAKQAFAEECYYEDWADLNADFADKNWGVEWQFNGETSTFDLRSPRPSTAVYAKLEEVIMPTDENEHKPHYKYTSVDGTKFYNIRWYHESNIEDESYTLFDSLEAAIESYNIIPKI